MRAASQPGDLSGKTVLVTGGAYGIGRAIVLRAAGAGAVVVLADLPSERRGGEQTAAEARQCGSPTAIFLGCDVSDGAQVKEMVQAAIAAGGGRLDVVYANAGIGSAKAWAHELSDAEFARCVGVNLGGAFHTAKYALPALVASRGSLVLTASSFGLVASHFAAAYCASKAGVAHLARQLAVDYGPLGVRVNALCPGYVHNAMGRSVPGVRDDLVPAAALRRASQPATTQAEATAAWARRVEAAARQPLGRQAAARVDARTYLQPCQGAAGHPRTQWARTRCTGVVAEGRPHRTVPWVCRTCRTRVPWRRRRRPTRSPPSRSSWRVRRRPS